MKLLKIRWFVIFMVFIATGLSFLDRQVLSIAIIKIQREFRLSDMQYGWVNSSFLIGYALMFSLGGRLIDLYGSKKGLAASVGIWSFANTLHGVMANFGQMAGLRFLLGVGEGGCFPGAAKAANEWFGKKERALANGIAIGGSAIGAVIAPPLTIWISLNHGWRWSFVIPGLLGMVWVLIWLCLPKHRDVNLSSPDNIENPPAAKSSFVSLLATKEAWVFIVMRFMLDPVLYFIMFWVPKYLSAERHVDYKLIGDLFWIPFLALGLSNIAGGWLSDRLVRKNQSVNRARKTVMGVAAALTMVAPLITMVSGVGMAVALMAVIMLAHGFWITNYITSVSDVFGNMATSTVVGVSGTAGAISSLIINPLIGSVIHHHGYSPLWWFSGIMYPLAFVIFVIFIPKIQLTTIKK